jgi:hypothetical protein
MEQFAEAQVSRLLGCHPLILTESKMWGLRRFQVIDIELLKLAESHDDLRTSFACCPHAGFQTTAEF